MPEKKKSAAQQRATARWEKENYDKILARFPKGTKEKILATGTASINSFIVNSVLSALGENRE